MKSEIDALLRRQIVNEVREAITEVMEMNKEEWITAEQLSRQFSFFTPSWIKTYGQLLPRERIGTVTSKSEHRTGWGYPLHRIERMVAEGKLRRMVMIEGKGRSKRYLECFPMEEAKIINQ